MNQSPTCGYQVKALLIKNLHLQKRQPCTNLCQILTPIICLILTSVIRNVAIDNIPNNNDTIYALIPLIATKFNNYLLFDQFYQYVYRYKTQWFTYQCRPNDQKFVGYKNQSGSVGLLGQIQDTSQYPVYYNNSLQNTRVLQKAYAPLFKKAEHNVSHQLFHRYQFLNNQTLAALKHSSSSEHLPDGAINFKVANTQKIQANIRVKDVRQFLFYQPNGLTVIYMRANTTQDYKKFYIIPEGFLSMMHMITNAFSKAIKNTTIQSGFMYMPISQQGSVFVDILINTVATIIFPLSLSLLLPVFLYLIVLQKQEKLIQMMRMNGMGITNYWAINFMYNFVMSLLTTFVFYFFGYFYVAIPFFKQTAPSVFFVIFFGWILCQISMSMLLQVFLSSSRAANIIGYLVAIWTNLLGATFSIALFQYPNPQPSILNIWPTFAFDRLFYLLFTYCSMDQCLTSVSNFTQQMKQCLTALYLCAFIFAFLGMYLFQVIPQQFGVAKSWYFPIQFIVKKFRKINKQKDIYNLQISNCDQTIKQQKNSVEQALSHIQNHPLIINGLTKRYSNQKLAVNNFNLIISDNSIFGLLGPNGAGKTTLLSMITGIFSPSKGTAYVSGNSIITDIDKAHVSMGVCPQFDILWPTLNVEQHLYFYARLRGVNSKQIKLKVQDALQQVNLQNQRYYKVTALSGGMKRRLSIGISLVGNPRIVFLDQPTTGLDPQNRRHLWQVLANCRKKRSLFLTTHLMQQAQSLCDKIGIITNGCLRTVGDSYRLKKLYGKGYFITISVQNNKQKSSISQFEQAEEQSSKSYSVSSVDQIILAQKNKAKIFRQQQQLKQKLLRLLAPATIVKQIGGMIKINIQEQKISTILQILNELKQEINLNFDWAISDSSLEDVFMEVVIKFDQNQASSQLILY